MALPCQILVSVDGCQSLTAFGSCIHWMPAPSRRPKTPAGTAGKAQGGLPLGNPVCLWQTELFKLNLKSSPSSSGYNRRRRLAPRSSGKQQAERTSVRAAPIVCPEESPLLAATHDNSVIRETITGGLTRRLRRELGLVILWASRRLSVPEGFQRGTKGSGYPVDTTAEGG